ncbi:MAG: class I SAM-dependent methyltransferase [Acidimicrobiales bacterium]
MSACPACGRGGLEVVHCEDDIPLNSCLLLDSREEALAFPRGRMRLAFCGGCGFLTNTAFSQAEYSSRYEETQGFSPRFVEFGKELAGRWVAKHHLAGKSVLEIGCGKGEFLVWMVEAGAGQGIGIDPGVNSARIDTAAAERLTWIADFYSEAYTHLRADAVVCRHTLEHIAPVAEFMRMVRRAIGDRPETVVLFELPDVARVLDEAAFWDVYHEHCSYFSAGSLARLFRASGFEVLDLSLEYDGQYLVIEARPAPGCEDGQPAPGEPLAAEDDPVELQAGVERFRREYAELTGRWRRRLTELSAQGGRAVIWGAGSKGVAFLNGLGLRQEIEYAVDVNPFKAGKHMAGTGQQIVGPEFLRSYRPDLVIAMNPIYLPEIRASLDELGVTPELVGI